MAEGGCHGNNYGKAFQETSRPRILEGYDCDVLASCMQKITKRSIRLNIDEEEEARYERRL